MRDVVFRLFGLTYADRMRLLSEQDLLIEGGKGQTDTEIVKAAVRLARERGRSALVRLSQAVEALNKVG